MMEGKKGIKEFFLVFIKMLSYVAIMILFLLVIFLMYYIITSAVAKSKKTIPPLSIFTIVSPSMEPNINIYDIIVDKKIIDESDVRVGDIITFYSNNLDTGGYTVTHRVSRIEEINGQKIYHTKGDNNQNEDEGYITFNEIVGRVIIIIPDVFHIHFFISSRLGWFFIILIPAISVIIYDIVKIKRIVKIKKQIEVIPQFKEISKVREKEISKKTSVSMEKARNFGKRK